MSKINHIINTPLPKSQDFESLKAEGLAYIQQYGGKDWTNLNASDPGVTILEQVCYALTELGYCNDFSIADILTDENGNINFENQFYLPENILTTAPVTIEDYRKYLIDGIEGVGNAVIVPHYNSGYKNYKVYLQLSETIQTNLNDKTYCISAHQYLNKYRNLCELFDDPQLLTPKTYLLSGTIEVKNEKDIQEVITTLQHLIREYIFPDVAPIGYNQLVNEGVETDTILNGPLLQRGWIPTAILGDKKDALKAFEVSALLNKISAVETVSNIAFTAEDETYSQIQCKTEEILTIAINESVNNGSLQFYCKGRKANLNATQTPEKLHLPDDNILMGASVERQTELPKGRYRDINSYYSIQNTFPDIYKIGPNAIDNDSDSFKVAQSRQLKGYLTLFDQVIANQFSQLANVGNLFSFKNSLSGIPSQKEEYYAVQDAKEKANPAYPVPYNCFSPTYYYQALYDVPHIKPLLKNNNVFDFDSAGSSQREKEVNSWQDYKNDPYNSYIWGLMQLMENEDVNLQRRNSLLDHLLARHGESPELMDAYIDGTVISGNSIKDKVIIKSVYLQNYSLLSYNRYKSYNAAAANNISGIIPKQIPADFEKQILKGYSKDFIFNSNALDWAEKLGSRDFINYTGIELKINLLFGLKLLYRDFIVNTKDENSATNRLAFWLIKQRKGLIFLEMPLLLKELRFNIIITQNPESGTYYKTKKEVGFAAVSSVENYENTIHRSHDNLSLQLDDSAIDLETATIDNADAKNFKPLGNSSYYFSVYTSGGTAVNNPERYANLILLFLPGFIPVLNGNDFKSRLTLFLENTLPLQCAHSTCFLDTEKLTDLIEQFSNYHNALLFNNKNLKNTEQSAENLFKFINNLNPLGDGW